MVEWVIRILLYALSVTASNWRGLGWRAAIAAALVLGAFGLVTGGRFSLQVSGGDANIGAGIVLFYAILWVPGGFIARIMSLTARRFGHARPWSLWIETILFFGWPALMRTVFIES